MKKMFLPLALITLLLSACCKDDDGLLLLGLLLPEGPAVPCDPTQATPYESFYTAHGYLESPRLSDGSQVLTASLDGLFWNDLESGALLYEIKSPAAGKAFSYADAVYRHGDLAVASSATKLAAINLKTGKLAWERTLGDCDIQRGVFGVGDQYFVTRRVVEPDGIVSHALFVGDLRDGDRLDLLCTPSYSRDTHFWAGYGWITSVHPFAGEDGHAYVLISFFESKDNSYTEAHFMALYDVTDRAWIYDRRPIHTKLGIRQVTIAGTSAYMGVQNQVVEWDLAQGYIKDSLSIVDPHSHLAAEQIWSNEQYILVLTGNGDLEAFDRNSHASLYRIARAYGTVQVEFGLDRLVTLNGGTIGVFKVSTGERLQQISPPCEGFKENLVVWKDYQGVTWLAAAGGAGHIYRYKI